VYAEGINGHKREREGRARERSDWNDGNRDDGNRNGGNRNEGYVESGMTVMWSNRHDGYVESGTDSTATATDDDVTQMLHSMVQVPWGMGVVGCW
jgi:hypothetical protein